VISTGAPEELRLDNRLLQKDKSKEVLKNNSKKTKIQRQLTDMRQGLHHHPHLPHPQATQP
jgi:hypothetical protein